MKPDVNETGRFYVGRELEHQGPLIFLSYAKEDLSRVEDVYLRLRTEHLNPWLDIADLMPGQEWEKVILGTIRSARFIIVFLSNNSINKRGYVQKEIKEALDAADKMPEGDVFIIPVRLEECPVPERLARWQWVDIYRQNGFIRLVEAIIENLGPEAPRTPSPRVNAKILVMAGTDRGTLFHLKKMVCLIGRSTPNSDIIPDIDLKMFDSNRVVSRRHALITRVGYSFIIKDCGSSNGTIINSTIRLTANQTRILKSGDELRLGNTLLYFIADS